MTARRRALGSPWIPAALAAALAVGLYTAWIRPTQARIDAAEQALRSARQQAASLQAQIARDRAVPPVPLPVGKPEFDRLWPDVVQRAQAAGYRLESVAFSAAPPLPVGGQPGGDVTPVEITARFTGPYLPLDDALASMQSVLPLWSWRSLHIGVQESEGARQLLITVGGVVPVAGRIGMGAGPQRGPAPMAPPPGQPAPPPPGRPR
jgi:hypothetical protein